MSTERNFDSYLFHTTTVSIIVLSLSIFIDIAIGFNSFLLSIQLSLIICIPSFIVGIAGAYIDQLIKNFSDGISLSYVFTISFLSTIYITLNSELIYVLVDNIYLEKYSLYYTLKNFILSQNFIDWILKLIEFITLSVIVPVIISVVTITFIYTVLLDDKVKGYYFSVVQTKNSSNFGIALTILTILIFLRLHSVEFYSSFQKYLTKFVILYGK